MVHGKEASEPVTRRAFDERRFATQPSGTFCAGRRPNLPDHSIRFQAKGVIDHHSRIGPVPRQNPEIVFPMAALRNLVEKQIVGSLSPIHVSFMGGIQRHHEVENELAPAIARELKQADVDLALLVPY